MSKIELKSCPFCKALCFVKQKDKGGLYKIVGNHDDECVFCEMGWWGGYETEEAAAEAWNRRTDCGRVKNDYSEWLQPEPAVPLTSYIRHTRAKSMEQEDGK